MNVDELQTAVAQLEPKELALFTQWFKEHLADRWDCQIELDVLGGRLDSAMHRADEDFESGRCTPLG